MFSRKSAFTLVLLFASLRLAAETPAGNEFEPLYQGGHTVALERRARLIQPVRFSDKFMEDARLVTAHGEWYAAEMVLLVDERGQVRDVFVTEAMPSRNLSGSLVKELRQQKAVTAAGRGGALPDRFAFRVKYQLYNQSRRLGKIVANLKGRAAHGDAGAQYTLSRLIFAVDGMRTDSLDSETLLRASANPGGDRRAMFALSNTDGPLQEQRRWLLDSARAGFGPAQILVALDAWSERTPPGYARARHWLEAVRGAEETIAAKYLAALLVAHPTKADDAKTARDLASKATQAWHGKGDPDAWQILAAAESQGGSFARAVEAQSKAIELAGSTGWEPTVLNQRLEAFRSQRVVTEEIVVIPAVQDAGARLSLAANSLLSIGRQ